MKALKWLAYLVSDVLTSLVMFGAILFLLITINKIDVHQISDHIWIVTRGN